MSAVVCTICVIWLFPVAIFVPWIFVYDQRTFLVDDRHEFVACHADWPTPWMRRGFTVGVVFLTCRCFSHLLLSFFSPVVVRFSHPLLSRFSHLLSFFSPVVIVFLTCC